MKGNKRMISGQRKMLTMCDGKFSTLNDWELGALYDISEDAIAFKCRLLGAFDRKRRLGDRRPSTRETEMFRMRPEKLAYLFRGYYTRLYEFELLCFYNDYPTDTLEAVRMAKDYYSRSLFGSRKFVGERRDQRLLCLLDDY